MLTAKKLTSFFEIKQTFSVADNQSSSNKDVEKTGSTGPRRRLLQRRSLKLRELANGELQLTERVDAGHLRCGRRRWY
jgi:hypothetical protein